MTGLTRSVNRFFSKVLRGDNHMTRELYENLGKAFTTDCPPITVVGVDNDERVFVVAQIYESYYPKMPKGARNSGYQYSGIFEMIDKGDYCVLRDVKLFRWKYAAEIAFRTMAREQNWRCADNNAELKGVMTCGE